MFVRFYDPGTDKYLGKVAIAKNIRNLLFGGTNNYRPFPDNIFYQSTMTGMPGIRPYRRGYAADARENFVNVRSFVSNTGFVAKVYTNKADARALLSAGLVRNDGGTYVIERDGVVR